MSGILSRPDVPDRSDRCFELLQGKLSQQVMSVVTDHHRGLFPNPGEIRLECGCPDGASMCKHVAAVLYGVGSRLDDHPESLFVLRGVDTAELIATEMTLPGYPAADNALADDALAGIFGIDLDTGGAPPPHLATFVPPESGWPGFVGGAASPSPAERPVGLVPAVRKGRRARVTDRSTRSGFRYPGRPTDPIPG